MNKINQLSEFLIECQVFGPIFIILFGISSSSLYLGLKKSDACPIQPYLPQILLAFGLLGSICIIIALISVNNLFYSSLTTSNRLKNILLYFSL